MRWMVACALTMLAASCTAGEPAREAAPVAIEPEQVETEPEAPPPQPAAPDDTAPAQSPRDTYLDALEALRSGDGASYAASFAATLRCFHGRRDVARDQALAARIGAAQGADEGRVRAIDLSTVRESADEVELVDWGWATSGQRISLHQKRILLVRDGGRWLIAVETPLADRRCGLPPIQVQPPPVFEAIRVAYTRLWSECECDEEEECPGIGGSIGCDTSSTELPPDLCTPGPERAACLRHAIEEADAFGWGSNELSDALSQLE